MQSIPRLRSEPSSPQGHALLNAQVASISGLSFRQDFSLAPALKHSSRPAAPFFAPPGLGCFNNLRNSYGAWFDSP